MKKLIFISLICFLGNVSYSQFYPVPPQSLGSIGIMVRDTAGFAVRQTFVMPCYADTTAANNSGYPKNYKGSMIFTTTDSKVWVRNNTMNLWSSLAGGGTLQGIQSVLDYNNYLNRNDSIKAASYDLVIDSAGKFIVKALNSVAIGWNLTATGSHGTALGELTTASGNNSTAMGISSTASGFATVAAGANTLAANNYSVAFGHGINATGAAAFGMGEYSNATGNNSGVIGSRDTTSGAASILIGSGLVNTSDSTIKIGFGNSATANHNIGISNVNNLIYGNSSKVLSLDSDGNLISVDGGGGGSGTLQQTITNGSTYIGDSVITFSTSTKINLEADSLKLKAANGIAIWSTSNNDYGSMDLEGDAFNIKYASPGHNTSLSFGSALDNNTTITMADTAVAQLYEMPKVTTTRTLPVSVNGEFADEWGNINTSGSGGISLSQMNDSIDVVKQSLLYKISNWGIDSVLAVGQPLSDNRVVDVNGKRLDFNNATLVINGGSSDSAVLTIRSDTKIGAGYRMLNILDSSNSDAFIVQQEGSVNMFGKFYMQNKQSGFTPIYLAHDTADSYTELWMSAPDTDVPFYQVKVSRDGGSTWKFNSPDETPQVKMYSRTDEPCAEFKRRVEMDSTLEVGGVILPTYAALDLSGGDYTATAAGYYEITTGDLINAFILPDATTFNGQQITVINASALITPVTNSTFITSLPATSVTVYSAIGGVWYGK